MMRDNSTTKKCIFVLGMHRSGTSALTGVLKLLGADLGIDLMRPTADNEKGYFENNRIQEIDDRLLEHLGSSWDDPFPLPERWWLWDSVQRYKENIRSVIESEFTGELIAIKDPRICRLFPLYQLIAAEMGIEVACLIPLRNPMEVGASLKRRNSFSIEKSLLLWASHMFEAEWLSRDYPRFCVSFDRLLTKTKTVLADIGKALGIHFPESQGDSNRLIQEFLDPNLKHNRQADGENADNGLTDAFLLYDFLLSMNSDGQTNRETLENIDCLRSRFYDYRRFFYHKEIGQQLEDLKAEKELNRRMAQSLELTNRMLMEKDNLIAEKNREIVGILNSRSWRVTAPLRSGARKLKIWGRRTHQ